MPARPALFAPRGQSLRQASPCARQAGSGSSLGLCVSSLSVPTEIHSNVFVRDIQTDGRSKSESGRSAGRSESFISFWITLRRNRNALPNSFTTGTRRSLRPTDRGSLARVPTLRRPCSRRANDLPFRPLGALAGLEVPLFQKVVSRCSLFWRASTCGSEARVIRRWQDFRVGFWKRFAQRKARSAPGAFLKASPNTQGRSPGPTRRDALDLSYLPPHGKLSNADRSLRSRRHLCDGRYCLPDDRGDGGINPFSERDWLRVRALPRSLRASRPRALRCRVRAPLGRDSCAPIRAVSAVKSRRSLTATGGMASASASA